MDGDLLGGRQEDPGMDVLEGLTRQTRESGRLAKLLGKGGGLGNLSFAWRWGEIRDWGQRAEKEIFDLPLILGRSQVGARRKSCLDLWGGKNLFSLSLSLSIILLNLESI